MFNPISAVLATVLVAGCASTPDANNAARSELAPTGKLRVGVNLSNTLFTNKDAATGELRGVSIDVMNELGSRLGVPVEHVVHPTPGDVTDAVDKGTWDVAILAIEQARAEMIAFSPAMTEIEATYLVHKNSALKSVAQVDAQGVRIATPEKAGYELYLTRTLRNATLIRTRGLPAAMAVFNEQRSDAIAGLRPALLDSITQMPDAKFVEGNFMTVNHGIGTQCNRGLAAEYLKNFVEDLNASGFVARSIVRHDVKGLSAVK